MGTVDRAQRRSVSSLIEHETRERGLGWNDLGGGYTELTGGLFRLLLVEIDVVADEEQDDLLRLFSHDREHTLEAMRFWADQVGTKEARMATHDLEDYDEVFKRFAALLSPEQRLAGLTTEERMAGLAPEQVVRALGAEQVVRALGPDQLLPAMPDEVLRALSDEFIAKLAEPTRSVIGKRLGR